MKRKAFRIVAEASLEWGGHHHGDLRRALLRQAIHVIESKGPGALSMRGLARDLDASHAAPLYYFKDRSALAIAIASVAFQDLGDALAAIPTASSHREHLLNLFLGYVEYALAHPALYRFMYSSEVSDVLVGDGKVGRYEESRMEVVQEKARVFDLFVTTVAAGQNKGEFRSGPADNLARVITSLAHGLSHEFIDERLGAHMTGPRARRKHARQLFERVMEGLVRPHARG